MMESGKVINLQRRAIKEEMKEVIQVEKLSRDIFTGSTKINSRKVKKCGKETNSSGSINEEWLCEDACGGRRVRNLKRGS